MTQIICIANQKGGVGKTTTAINLSTSLAMMNKKTLLVDCDPQANATTGIGVDKAEVVHNLYHGLIGEASIEEVVIQLDVENLFLIPSQVELIGFEVEMMDGSGRETVLKKFLKPCHATYDYIILDCPPSLSLLTLNAMIAANAILIPLQSEFYALEGLSQLLQTVKRIKGGLNKHIKIAGILLTMFDKRTNLSCQVAEDAKKYFKELVFETKIPRNVRLGEAPSFGKPIALYDPSSAGARSYRALAKEILKNE